MAHLLNLGHTILSFGVVLGVLVFIHEMGHYLAARWRGVYVEAFSIGFGRTLFSRTDRHGTVWKICILPLGGYVKMHGMAQDGGPIELTVDDGDTTPLPAVHDGGAFWQKPVSSRAIIVAAGPVANFLLAIVLFTILYASIGQQVALPVVGEVVPGSAAAIAGLQKDDAIRSVDGTPVARFEELRAIVAASAGKTLNLAVHRGNADLVVPVRILPVDAAVGKGGDGRLGVKAGAIETIRLSLSQAMAASVSKTWEVLVQTLQGLGHIFASGHGVGELGGPLAIAQLSGQVASLGIANLIAFIGLLSINLGLMNLLPVPILDGGHLMFYLVEAIRGRPVPARAQDYGYRVGFALIASLFIVISFNDLMHLGAFSWLAKLGN